MDLREIIKWFIPCFHILLLNKVKMDSLMIHICLFLLFISRPSYGADVNSLVSSNDTKNVDSLNVFNLDSKSNQSEFHPISEVKLEENGARSFDISVGRTFGRPMMKKLISAIIPLAFQIGAASTWAVVAAIVGFKTLLVALVILKILLVAGAAKVGALFGQKAHSHGHGWEPPQQKEIHLHIHNGGHHETVHEEHPAISTWSRDGAASDSKSVIVVNPYAAQTGPQTISTPYGNYVRVDSPQTAAQTLDLSSFTSLHT